MIDMATVTTAIAALRTVVGLAKDVNQVEFNQRIIDLQSVLLTMQGDMLALHEENRTLKDQIREAGARADTEAALTADGGVYWRAIGDGKKDGPFCTACFDNEGKLIRVHEGATEGHYSCPVHKGACRTVEAIQKYRNQPSARPKPGGSWMG